MINIKNLNFDLLSHNLNSVCQIFEYFFCLFVVKMGLQKFFPGPSPKKTQFTLAIVTQCMLGAAS